MNINKLRFYGRYPVFYYDEDDQRLYMCSCLVANIYTIKEKGGINYVIQRSQPEVGEKEFVRLEQGVYEFSCGIFYYRYRIKEGYRWVHILKGYEYLGEYEAEYEDEDDECMNYCNGDSILAFRNRNQYKLVFSDGEIKNVSRGRYILYGNYYNSMYTFVDEDDYIQERYMNI